MTQSLHTLSSYTGTYIPLAPYLLNIISSFTSTKVPKGSNSVSGSALKPLDISTHIRAPNAYLKSRIFSDGMIDEALFLLLQWAAALESSIAFPEIMVPVLAGLKRCLKAVKHGKGHERASQTLKTAIERLEEGRMWVLEKRKGVEFSPDKVAEVAQWQERMKRLVKKGESPVAKYASVFARKKKREQEVLERARAGKGEVLDNA